MELSGGKSALFIGALHTLIQLYKLHTIVQPRISGKNADNTNRKLATRTLTGWRRLGSVEVFGCFG